MRKIVFVDALFPDPLFGAGFSRASKILNFFANQRDFSVHFLALWQDWSANRDSVLSLLPPGVGTTVNVNRLNFKRILLEQLQSADALWVSRFPVYEVVMGIRDAYPESFAGVKMIYDSECIESLRVRLRRKAIKLPLSKKKFNRLLENEMGLARQADLLVAVSAQEQRLFEENGCKSVVQISHVVNAVKELRPLNDCSGLLFVGRLMEKNAPNVDSLSWFGRTCYPELHREGISCRVVGSTSKGLRKRFEKMDYEVSGSIPDLSPAFNAARLFIAPTRFAAGIPLKVIDAAAAGLPVVATRLLCEQLGWIPDVEILVADSPKEFLNKINNVLEDEDLWYQIQKRAHARVSRDFSSFAFEKSLSSVLALVNGAHPG